MEHVQQELAITRVPLDALHLDPANARAHDERNLAAIEASLARFGQAEPLVVQAGTGRVIAGNGRLVAMRKLGWTECDVVELTLESVDAAALGIALNRTGELASWDEPALGRLLEELQQEDALLGVGFDDAEIQALLEDLGNSGTLSHHDATDTPGADDQDLCQRDLRMKLFRVSWFWTHT